MFKIRRLLWLISFVGYLIAAAKATKGRCWLRELNRELSAFILAWSGGLNERNIGVVKIKPIWHAVDVLASMISVLRWPASGPAFTNEASKVHFFSSTRALRSVSEYCPGMDVSMSPRST